jgi:hypothetical protein
LKLCKYLHLVFLTKYNKTRKTELKTSVFATSNTIEKMIVPLQSRFFVVNMQACTCEQFHAVTLQLLTSDRHNIDEEIAKATTDAVWKTSKGLRDFKNS